MFGAMFMFVLTITIIRPVAITLAIPLVFAFFLAFPLNLSAPITVTITIMVAGLITAAFAVHVIMSGGVASVAMLRCQWKTSKRAHAECERQNPCKLP
jgi:hypothetical protein